MTTAAQQSSEPVNIVGNPVELSIVVPCYNEWTSLQGLMPEIFDACDEIDREPCEIILVDDGSTDGTFHKMRGEASAYESVIAVRLQDNYGQSAALAAGIDRAQGDVIIPMDGDRQNDPADIPALLSKIDDGADVVSGWRRDRDDPLRKRIPSAIQTRLATYTGPDIHDFGCTLTAYRAEAIKEVSLRGERHRYIPAQLDQLGYDVTEVEVNHRPRKFGKSSYGIGRLMRGFVDLIYHLFRRWRARPMHIFGGLGLLTFGFGVCLGTGLVGAKYLVGYSLLSHLPALLLAVALTLFGAITFALGLITELLTELLYQNKRPYRVEKVVE